jgi:glycosyltransferase involved in cell wall biosynthesis
MITPFQRSQRGNRITSTRLKKGLEARGYTIDLVSLEETDAVLQLEEKLKNKHYAFIHAFHALHWGRLLEKLPRMQEIPILLTTTGTDLHFDLHGKDATLIKKSLFSAQKIVCFHQDFIALISARYPALLPRLMVIPQGIEFPPVDAPTSLPVDFQQDDFIFFFPSGLRPVKNFELLIDALEKIQPDYPHMKLLIIGAIIDPQYGQKILARIKTLPWVTYLGEIPHENVPDLILRANVVVNSSQAEGQPQGALEAMSLGLPCILTAVPGNLHIIEDGREGFYVHNAAELAKAARLFMDNPQLTKTMGLAARELVAKYFSRENELNAYVDLYRQLVIK